MVALLILLAISLTAFVMLLLSHLKNIADETRKLRMAVEALPTFALSIVDAIKGSIIATEDIADELKKTRTGD